MDAKASETCRAILQLQINILPSCITLVLFYILTYDARKPKHKKTSLYHSVPRVRLYRGTDKSLARPTSQYILFDGENISFDASLVIYINSTNIPSIMIINRIYENQNRLSLYFVSLLVGLRTSQHPTSYKHEGVWRK